MMNKLKFLVSLLTTALWMHTAVAQKPVFGLSDAQTVISNPGQDASSEIRLNWHTGLGSGDSYITFTQKKDKKWKKARTLKADQELCIAFDSIYSKRPNGEDFYENVRFLRNTISLQGLQAHTEYMYTIGPESEVRYFKTAPKNGNWSAGIISDMHVYAPLPKRQKVAMEMVTQLEKKNKRNFDFMLHVGDLSAWGGSYSFWPTLYADQNFKKYMWAGVNGNHDNMTRKNEQSNDFFRFVNNNPLNGYPGQIGVSYHFTYNNALFIMLNNENMKSSEGLGQAQNWVRQVIKSSPAKYVIVVSHYEWFMGDSGRSSQYNRWKKLFDESGVDLAISGNNHIYARTNAIYADRETDGKKGTVYVQTPSSDNERGRSMSELVHNQDLIKFRWTEGNNTVGGMLMKATKKHLKLALYDRTGALIDQVTVEAKR